MSKLIINETRAFRNPKLILGLSVIVTYGTHSGDPVLNQPGSPQCTCSSSPVETPVQIIHGHQIYTYIYTCTYTYTYTYTYTFAYTYTYAYMVQMHCTNAWYMVHGTWYMVHGTCRCICICVHHTHRHTHTHIIYIYIHKMTPVKGW